MNTQTLDTQSQEQLMFTQPKDPINKTNSANKKYCSFCHRTNHSISACFKKQRDDEEKRDAYARSKSPQKSFVQYFRSPSNDRRKQYDNRHKSRSTSRDNSYNKTYSRNRYRSSSRGRFSYDKSKIHALIVHRTDLIIDHLLDTILAQDTDHFPIPETIILQNIQTHTDHLPDQEILDFLDLVLTPTLEIKSI